MLLTSASKNRMLNGLRQPSPMIQFTESFDEVLYPGYPFPESHPERLATHATLFGMTPPSLENCRVLELGCGDGSNLIPVAFGLPGSRCTGIDLAARPIARGQALMEFLGLRNITLRQLDVAAITQDFGQFDYIIAHGLYSWVAPEIREKVLGICSENLAPDGIAYVSYNAYPGGHVREMIRNMMLFSVRDLSDPEERVRRGLGSVQALIESRKESDPYRQIIEPELRRMMRMNPRSLLHDDFADFNAPVYFHEFIARAGRHGLQFLAEAEFPAMQAARCLDVPESSLPRDETIAREQMLDFALLRKFRQTLLCRREIQLDGIPRADRVRQLLVSSSAQPASSAVDPRSETAAEFRTPDGKKNVSTNHPLTKAALLHLGANWPERIPFARLKAAAQAAIAEGPEAASDPPLESMLLKMYAGDLVELHFHAPALALNASERPVSSPLARWQLREGNVVTNLNHSSILVDDVLKNLILLLDGTRDRPALLREMGKRIASGEMALEQGDQPISGAGHALEILTQGLEGNLQKMARLALLVTA